MHKIISKKLGIVTAILLQAAVMIPMPSFAAVMVGDSHYQTQEYDSFTDPLASQGD